MQIIALNLFVVRGPSSSLMSEVINFNGELLPGDTPVFRTSSRAARFGDALFETMLMSKGRIMLSDLHGDRLFSGLRLLKFQLPTHFTWQFLLQEIERVTPHYNHEFTRVRLMVSRGEGAINEDAKNTPQFLVECFSSDNYHFNEEGFRIGIFEKSRKGADEYSHLKSSNFLPYVMAALYAKENKWDECLLLNHHDRICDGTISNIFWIQQKIIFTPPLSEGGIAGTIRRYLIEALPKIGMEVKEKPVTADELINAKEIFLTNAVRGIRWVRTFREMEYQNTITLSIFNNLIIPLTK